MSVKKRGILAASVAALALTVTALTGCASDANTGADEGDSAGPVRIGVVPGGQPYWDVFVEEAANEGIEVEIVDFAEYPIPNPALTEGELDLNQFQHIIYLANYNVDADEDLVAIGSTVVYPMNVFSDKYDDLADIPEGGVVAIPNDESNRARALLVLQKLGLIELKDGGSATSSPDDIIADKSKVTVTEVAADIIPVSLPDVDAGVINNDYVEPAGLDFADSLGADSADDPAVAPYTNIFAARSEDADNETYLKLVDIYQNNEKVQAAVKDYVGDGAVLLQTPREELAAILAQAEEDYRASKG
ncbi:MetQ/NlpA family ABC transporter substrate-binding protein [Leucobacter denitrificans]|uniref:Methionine ABC transporter substrate-binding protein n=1 Tax=Leucobacter denitrificans TaxID=683042 RepID=A0A7G9S5L8_9MICO|nr:MetQ/NlpA family ABC transporter substrate-binding protein [Leucobacter denitrificans]QNN63143.1 methionine ABC transporter substrate-binding protein [Leucobacter denitrificans]